MRTFVLRVLGLPVLSLSLEDEPEEADAAPDGGPIHPAQGMIPTGEPADALIGFHQPPWIEDRH